MTSIGRRSVLVGVTGHRHQNENPHTKKHRGSFLNLTASYLFLPLHRSSLSYLTVCEWVRHMCSIYGPDQDPQALVSSEISPQVWADNATGLLYQQTRPRADIGLHCWHYVHKCVMIKIIMIDKLETRHPVNLTKHVCAFMVQKRKVKHAVIHISSIVQHNYKSTKVTTVWLYAFVHQ